nr:choice-of-anchor D domain-containing protein [bacterium]
MRKKLLFVTILMFMMASLSAIYVEVGSGAESTSYIPAYGFYDYGWSRTIYLQSDLVNEMEINTISYNVNNTPANYTMDSQSFYMKHTTASSIASTDYIDPATDDTYELVFSGNLTYNGGGWHDIILDTAFEYNGTDNLEILVLNNDGSYVGSSPTFVATSATPQRAIYRYTDGTFPTTPGTLSAVYPNTRFHFNVEGAPTYPTIVSPANNSLNNELDTDLVWTNGDNTESIHVYLSDVQEDVANFETSALVVDGDLVTSYSPTLENATVYYWRVAASNTTSEIVASTSIFSFSTTYGVAEAPYSQGFENVTPPALPLGWVAFRESTTNFSYVDTYLGQAYEGGNSLRLANSSDITGTYIAVLPQIENMGSRMKFWTKCSSTGAQLKVGYLADVSDPATFTEIETISTTTDYQEHTVVLELPRTIRYLAFKHANVATYQTIYIDNVLIEEIPENEPTPATLVSPANGAANIALDAELTWEYGINTVAVNLYLSEDVIEVTDLAQAAMVIENQDVTSYTGNFEEWTTYYWRVGSLNSTGYEVVSDIYSFTTVTPDGTIQIGTGSETNTHLPMEPYYGYTISQVIYDQAWLNVDDQRIEEVSYYYNGNSAWTEDNIQVYLGHTDLDEFTDGTSWLPIDNFVLVYDGPFSVAAEEGWVSIPLDLPFNYNNDDNLVIAFESNTQGYSNTNDEFYGSSVTGNKSIYYYSDSINSDFVNPASGTVQSLIANVMLTMGDIPSTPQLMVTPNEYSWDDTIINTTANSVTFTMRNTGLGALTINSVSLEEDVDFILTDTNTYPLDITGNTVQFSVAFNPQTIGELATNIIINDATNGDTSIPLTGTGYDAMISEFPHFEGFEGYNTGTIPQDWTSVINSTSTFAVVDITSTSFEGERGFRFYNSGDANASMTALTPPVNDLALRRIRFMGRSSTAGAGLIIGTASNNSGEINFTARDTVYFTTTYEQFQHGFDGAPENDQFIALQFVGTGATYLSVYLDNFFIETIPTGPAIVINQDTLDFGNVYLNRNGVAQLNIQNWGIAPLEVDFSQEGTELSFTPNEITIQPNATQNITVSLEPIAEGDYSGSFEVLS